MMQRFMSYRIVILNGDKRGERLDIGRSPLTIGRGAACDIQLPDPLIGEIHAKITPQPAGLHICVSAETHRLTVNHADVQESSLKHGDMVEIGTTRLFVQSQRSPGTWESLSEFRKWRKGITIGLPVLLLIVIALTYHRSNPKPAQHPVSEAALHRPHTSAMTDTNNTDWMVTNVPQILINSSIILTPYPPEIIEAREAFRLVRTNNIQQETAAALEDLEFATSFLAEARQHSSVGQSVSNEAINEAATNLADRLFNDPPNHDKVKDGFQ